MSVVALILVDLWGGGVPYIYIYTWSPLMYKYIVCIYIYVYSIYMHVGTQGHEIQGLSQGSFPGALDTAFSCAGRQHSYTIPKNM